MTELKSRKAILKASERPVLARADSAASDAPLPEGVRAFSLPKFTTQDLLQAIPKHCFERSAWKSFTYVFRDYALVAALGFAASRIDPYFAGLEKNALTTVGRWAAWNVYWFWQGVVGMGIWTLAHEAGHQAFSTSRQLNHAVGLVLHSFLLVPYHPWRITHGLHHKYTGHFTKDMVYVPRTRSEKGLPARHSEHDNESALREAISDAPIVVLGFLLFQQLLGWPFYLFLNIAGKRGEYGLEYSHFSPNSKLFQKKDWWNVVVSDIGLIATIAGLIIAGQVSGSAAVIKYYLVPYLWVNFWLIAITYLQHTDIDLPHYRENTWNFARGATATMDRTIMSFGVEGWSVGSVFIHSLAEKHVLHHVISTIPHYHADEATEAIKAVMGEHYYSTKENFFVSLWKSARDCRFVEDDEEVLFYRTVTGKYTRAWKKEDEDGASDSGVGGLSD